MEDNSEEKPSEIEPLKEEEKSLENRELPSAISFKKPSFIGKARGVKKLVNVQETTAEHPVTDEKKTPQVQGPLKFLDEETKVSEKEQPLVILPYKEPVWSGLPPQDSIKPYSFEVLKNGSIIETVSLSDKPYWIVGRLPSCDISMQHPTVSRYHAVVQYRKTSTETEEAGFYVYDLSSTHGTFLNNKSHKIKSKVYTRVHVGHMLKFGCSQRSYILTGPDQDQEEESEFSVTELKQQREEKIQKAKEEMIRKRMEEEKRKKKEDERGVDWGIGDDASEDEEDLTENPFAQTTNEELYLDDPKKALRGFFEREGCDLEYDCSEQGMGQFLCKVELPLDDDLGRPIVVEVLHKGKKKEAVVQCALEACRTLDRYGVLRQATHESRKRKAKNWEENDYYDSDEDTFLDRTGAIEKKREKRMTAKQPKKAETYESLIEKEKSMSTSIAQLEKEIQIAKDKSKKDAEQADEDSLDSFMKHLNEPQMDKQKLSKIKMDLSQLKKEHANIIRLINIAKPANLPPLVPEASKLEVNKQKPVFPVVGKRLKIKFEPPKRAENYNRAASSYADEEEDENDSDSEAIKDKDDLKENKDSEEDKIRAKDENGITKDKEELKDSEKNIRSANNIVDIDLKLRNRAEQNLQSIDKDIEDSNVKIEKIAEEKVVESKTTTDKHKPEFTSADSLIETLKRSTKPSKKKNKEEKLKGYEEEKLGEDYSMWVPPSDQSGDGRTSLNDKLGY